MILSGCQGPRSKLQTACVSEQRAPACVALADELERSDRNLVAARQVREAACRLGSADGCDRLADMLENGIGGPAQLERAVALREQECDAGRLPACEQLGNSLSIGGLKDPQRARAALKRACDGGRVLACARLEELAAGSPPVAPLPPARRTGAKMFALHIVGESANADKKRRCREAISAVGGRIDPHAETSATLTLSAHNHLKIRAGAIVFEEPLPGWTIPDLCRELVSRVSKTIARQPVRGRAYRSTDSRTRGL
jgi:TPR repeat protein